MGKIYAIDFDGTLCENKYPDIGQPIQEVVDYIRSAQAEGNRVILWTYRVRDRLQAAVDWCAEKGIVFDAVNENLQEIVEYYGGDSRKVSADFYIDDRAISVSGIKDGSEEVRKIRDQIQRRAFLSELKTRSESEELYVEGYFAVFNRETELWPGAYEEIKLEAFDRTLGNDIRALINHDTTFVLGRNKSGTLELKADSHGLWGRIKINPNDSDAMNLYERVKRGDVDQCSFGFNILKEETEWRDDGTVKWWLEEIDLHEVSVCTFPAYEETGVQARKAEVKQHEQRQIDLKKKQLKERLGKVC